MQQLRRDYVVMSESFQFMLAQSMVMSDFDGGFGHADNCPAMVEFKGVAHISQPNQKIRWDFNKMTKKEAQDVFAESLSTLPLRKKGSDLSCRKAHSMAYN